MTRRDGRGKFDQPWFKGDQTQDGGDDGKRASTKQNEWRRDRGPGRPPEWDQGAKAEQDPEWMDSTPSNEPRQAHTQEEFQRWKESMKAAVAEGNDRPSEKQAMVERPSVVKKPEPPPMPAFLEASQVESGMDKFFAVYGDRKVSGEQKPAEAKAHRKPRFAALFSPQPDDASRDMSSLDPAETVRSPGRATSAAVPVPVEKTDKAEQEHFQRVLQMLAGRSSNSTPDCAAGTAVAAATGGASSKRPKDTRKRGEVESCSKSRMHISWSF
ncbi:hypothetical protein HC762_01280 [bacterium]|nr:hypothetical protein [bacterium]